MKKVDISPFLIAALCLLAYCLPSGVYFPFLLAAGIHELAHLLMCRLCGVKIKSISLSLCGAIINAEFPSERKELLCVIAGPAVNLLGFICCFRHANFALFSLLLGVFNSLPLSMLDGGRILNLLLLRHMRFEKAEQACAITEGIISGMITVLSIVLCCVYHAGLWSILGSSLLLMKSRSLENILLFLPGRRKIKEKPMRENYDWQT